MKISDSWKPLSASLDPPSGYESDNEEIPNYLLNLDSRGMIYVINTFYPTRH